MGGRWVFGSGAHRDFLPVAGSRPNSALRDRCLIALLPQTQCGQCDYPGCRPYAEAIASGAADINQCPPGGEAGVRALAEQLGREPKPLSEAHGTEQALRVAFIREELCIGCVKCILACPVDTIVGAPKRMHTVIPELCTGCDLCLPPCPVDCIEMRPLAPPARTQRSIPLELVQSGLAAADRDFVKPAQHGCPKSSQTNPLANRCKCARDGETQSP